MDLGRLAIESGLREVPAPMIMDPATNATPAVTTMTGVAKKDEKLEAAKKARTLLALSPAPVGKLVDREDRQDPEKLLATLSERFLLGLSLPEESRRKLLVGFRTLPPLTDAAIRKLVLGLTQSPFYQVC